MLILSTFVIRDEAFRETVRYTVQGIGLMFVFTFCIQDRGVIAKLLSSAPLKWVALLSYTLYLVHYPLFEAAQILIENEILAKLSGLAISFGVSQLVYLYIERPAFAFRQFLLRKAITKQN